MCNVCVGSLDRLYDPLSKFSVLEGSVELLLKSMTKGYSVKDMSAADATKSMVKATFGYNQIELSSMVKQDVYQGEVVLFVHFGPTSSHLLKPNWNGLKD